jgi:hypothetical protein
MKGLSAKVFRTYNASITFQNQLDEGTPEDGTMQEKLNHYNHANRMVAILCNHQRAAPKTHDQSMARMKERVRVAILPWTDHVLTALVTAPWVQVRPHEVAPRSLRRRP